MVVSVIGLGYIGLPTAAILASNDIRVFGIDSNNEVVDSINKGQVHIVEPHLDPLVQKVVFKGNLKAFNKPKSADVFMIAVPTPFKNEYEPDLSYVKSAVKEISHVIEKGNMIILESTVPIGATENIKKWLLKQRPDLSFPANGKDINISDINIAHCPERVLPGDVLNELVNNDRIIGGLTVHCSERAKNFYQSFIQGDCIVTDCRTAELSKLVENSYRDVNIAFANEMSIICDKLDINVWELIKLANCHPRVNILQPGPGVGGHCIAVDPWFIIDSAPDQARLIHTARKVNDSKPHFVLEKINQAVDAIGRGKSALRIACLGLAYKPDIGDLRESPALQIAQQIESMGFAKLIMVEPNINEVPRCFDTNNCELSTLSEAITVSDIVVLLVDHSSFKKIDHSLLSGKQVIDTRGIWA